MFAFVAISFILLPKGLYANELQPTFVDNTHVKKTTKAGLCESLFTRFSRSAFRKTNDEYNVEFEEIMDHLQSQLEKINTLVYEMYGEKDGNMLIKLLSNSIGKRFAILLLEPGIANRLEQLFVFAKPYLEQFPQSTPLELRDAFVKSLGNRKVYRGMMLTNDQYKIILKRGIASKGLLNDSMSSVFDPNNPSIIRDISDHIMEMESDYKPELRGKNFLIPVTDHPLIAQSVAYHDASLRDKVLKKLYLFEFEIPEVTILKFENLYHRGRFFAPKTIRIGDFSTSEASDPGVEMFVPFFISNKFLKSSKIISEKPLKYRKTYEFKH